jgi:hypothetical protein
VQLPINGYGRSDLMRDPAKLDAERDDGGRLDECQRAEHCNTRQRDLLARSASMCRAAAARCEADNDAAAYPHLGILPHTQSVFLARCGSCYPSCSETSRFFSHPCSKATRARAMAGCESGRKRDLAEITSPNYPGERLMPCRNPLLDDERARKWRELLDATERKLLDIQARVRRDNKPLRGKDKIALAVGVDHYKMAKHFVIAIADSDLTFECNAFLLLDVLVKQ